MRPTEPVFLTRLHARLPFLFLVLPEDPKLSPRREAANGSAQHLQAVSIEVARLLKPSTSATCCVQFPEAVSFPSILPDARFPAHATPLMPVRQSAYLHVTTRERQYARSYSYCRSCVSHCNTPYTVQSSESAIAAQITESGSSFTHIRQSTIL